MQNKRLGDKGEALAAAYLTREGFTILERNFRCRSGELDLVAKDGSYLVFIEVKTRRSLAYGTPAQAIDGRKRERIALAAKFYLYEHRLLDSDCRFDIVEVYCTSSGRFRIHHIKDAFYV